MQQYGLPVLLELAGIIFMRCVLGPACDKYRGTRSTCCCAVLCLSIPTGSCAGGNKSHYSSSFYLWYFCCVLVLVSFITAFSIIECWVLVWRVVHIVPNSLYNWYKRWHKCSQRKLLVLPMRLLVDRDNLGGGMTQLMMCSSLFPLSKLLWWW